MNRGRPVAHLLLVLLVVGLTACSSEPKAPQTQSPAPALAGEKPAVQPAADPKPSFNGLRIHFKRGTDWGEPLIYIFEQVGPRTEEYSGSWPGSPMQPEGNGWYVYSAENVGPANVIFSDGRNQIPKPMWPQATFERPRGEWWYNGAWHDVSPEQQPPAAEKPQT